MTQNELRRKCELEAIKLCGSGAHYPSSGVENMYKPCRRCEPIAEALLKREVEIERLTDYKLRHFRNVEEIKSLQIEIERLNNELRSPIRLSEKLLNPLVDEKDDWKNRAIRHAEKVLLLQEQIKSLQEKLAVARDSLQIIGCHGNANSLDKELALRTLKEIGEA